MKNNQLLNYIHVVLDGSLSMRGLHSQAVSTFNSLLTKIKEQSKMTGQNTKVSLTIFPGKNQVPFVDVSEFSHINNNFYASNGYNTPLFKTVVDSITACKSRPLSNDENTSFLVVVITDGEDNASTSYDFIRFRELVKECNLTDRWTFAFQVPKGKSKELLVNFGVDVENIREWEQTEEGMEEVETTNNAGVQSFYTARSCGSKKVNTFYSPIPIDLGNVKSSDLKKNLVDLKNNFKLLKVDKNDSAGKEFQIRDFVELKTKKPYKIGSSHYLLIKEELVQPNKNILIVENGKSEVWGGAQARDLLGLPHNANAKVDPVNLKKYKIYVESRSVNRKLPRGTEVLVDITKNTDSKPTWDHNKV